MKQQLNGQEKGWWMLSYNGNLWLPDGQVPNGLASAFGLAGLFAMNIGEWLGLPVWLVRKNMPIDMVTVRHLLQEDTGLFQLAGRAVQLAEFYRSHVYCGYCGHKMHESTTEWCCLCSRCRQRYYPQIAPSVIVAIRRGDEILLAQHTRHRSGLYTVLAGFVEVGETLEEAVKREIFEEVQIKIKNLRYVASQPWPFPHSLMMAYMADYASGELVLDKKELIDGGWYHYEQLPLLPPPGTIARRLIEDTVALCRAEQEYDFE